MGDPNGAQPANIGDRGALLPTGTIAGDPPQPAARLARMFASPAGVLVVLPLLVIGAGIVVLLMGRRATRDTAETMARHQLESQAQGVQHDIDFALNQAEPVLAMTRSLDNSAMPTPDALVRLRDIVQKRPGIWSAGVAFPIGVMWSTFKDPADEVLVQETHVGATETTRTNYKIVNGEPVQVKIETSNYDPRMREYYKAAVDKHEPVWSKPRVFSATGKTGVTVSQAIYGGDGSLSAVLIVDFDAAELSTYIRRPPLEGARNVMFTADGTILAYPSGAIPDSAAAEKRLLRHEDFKDPALAALFAEIGKGTPGPQTFLRLNTSEGRYLASVSLVGKQSFDWYLASLVPERTLFGTMQRLDRDALIASGAALAIALGFALMFAWNILRMRRAVGVARAAARSAQERAKQLGSYRLVERLGAGGMGEVWRAEHQLLARKAAIKLVRPDVLARHRMHAALIQERFRREAQTLASMRSRHTIELYDYGVTNEGTFFYVMELLDGLDLSQLVREYGPQPAGRVISIIGQACQSLAEAHNAGLLHRDIKPANLVLCRAADEVDIVKVLDFGIVHNLTDPILPVALPSTDGGPSRLESGERLTTEGAVVGTPGYIPPEQAIGAPLDARGDLYALGCVAWYLLVGSEVFPAVSEEDVLRAHVNVPVPVLRERVRGWLPVELERLITQCLAKSPEERPEDAQSLAKALAAIAIPDEHAWSDTHAQMWWSSLQRGAKAHADAETARPDRVLVPAREDKGPGPEARTIEARRNQRTMS